MTARKQGVSETEAPLAASDVIGWTWGGVIEVPVSALLPPRGAHLRAGAPWLSADAPSSVDFADADRSYQ